MASRRTRDGRPRRSRNWRTDNNLRAVTPTHTRGDWTFMKRYVIERDLPAVGRLSEKQLNVVRKTSNEALRESGPGIQWMESFVTDDRIYCHYLAENEEIVRDHAR